MVGLGCCLVSPRAATALLPYSDFITVSRLEWPQDMGRTKSIRWPFFFFFFNLEAVRCDIQLATASVTVVINEGSLSVCLA